MDYYVVIIPLSTEEVNPTKIDQRSISSDKDSPLLLGHPVSPTYTSLVLGPPGLD